MHVSTTAISLLIPSAQCLKRNTAVLRDGSCRFDSFQPLSETDDKSCNYIETKKGSKVITTTRARSGLVNFDEINNADDLDELPAWSAKHDSIGIIMLTQSLGPRDIGSVQFLNRVVSIHVVRIQHHSINGLKIGP